MNNQTENTNGIVKETMVGTSTLDNSVWEVTTTAKCGLLLNKDLHNGSAYDLHIYRELELYKKKPNIPQGIKVFKESTSVVKFGVNIKNSKKYEEWKAKHSGEPVAKYHKVWLIPSTLIYYPSTDNFCIQYVHDDLHTPNVKYIMEKDGIKTEITKELAQQYCTASNFPKPDPDQFFFYANVKDIVSFAQHH